MLVTHEQLPETWAVVYDAPCYLVSSLGRMHSSLRLGKMLRPTVTSKGFAVVTIVDPADPSRHSVELVHRIVAEAFLGRVRGKIVRHRNGNKLDNRAVNLELISVQK